MKLIIALTLAIVSCVLAEPIKIRKLTDEKIVLPKVISDGDLKNYGIDFDNTDPNILEDARLTTDKLVAKYGYPVETHTVTTSDGYILTVHRIPGSDESPAAPNKPVVFLMHGFLCSSGDWVIMGPNKGFAYLLADLGYDVWLGNARGNRYSRHHVDLSPSAKSFWQFSWHEIGVIDLPTMIDYALIKTGQSHLHYVGHSQGTTSFFVMASERPEYNKKIRSMQALAPVAFMSHAKSPFIRAMVLFLDGVDWATSILGINEFLPNSEMLALGGQLICQDESITQGICSNILFLICGYNSEELNSTMMPVIFGHTPAGASTKQIIHYGQLVKSGYYRQYDFGYVSNLFKYGSIWPPNYDLSKISSPVSLHYSDNDWLAEPVDVMKLADGIGNLYGTFRVPYADFNHLDYLWAIDAKPMLYDKVVSVMREIEGKESHGK